MIPRKRNQSGEHADAARSELSKISTEKEINWFTAVDGT